MKKIYYVDGELIFHDPGPEMISVFTEIDPSYRVQSIQPDPSYIPKFQRLRRKDVRTNRPLFELTQKNLWSLFNSKVDSVLHSKNEYSHSLLDVLNVLSLKHIKECRLCGWNCGINRYSGKGKCGLENRQYHGDPFIHIAEEAAINPAIVTNFGGCAFRCVYCIEHKNWSPANLPELNPKKFWEKVLTIMNQKVPINTLEFANATESLPGLLAILNKAPVDFRRPVVLNTHLYGSVSFYEIANLIADVWLVDLRYGNDECAKELSRVDHYMKYAMSGLEAAVKQDAKVIVRILVLPGHLSCCHKPAIELLSQYRDKIWVSILDQYVPENEADLFHKLKNRPPMEEMSRVRKLTEISGLQNIESRHTNFWTI